MYNLLTAYMGFDWPVVELFLVTYQREVDKGK